MTVPVVAAVLSRCLTTLAEAHAQHMTPGFGPSLSLDERIVFQRWCRALALASRDRLELQLLQALETAFASQALHPLVAQHWTARFASMHWGAVWSVGPEGHKQVSGWVAPQCPCVCCR